jgi:hypothetical protein
LCDEHKNHWRRQTMFAWVSFGVFVAVGGLLVTATAILADPGDVAGLILLAVFVPFLIWLITVAIVQSRAIKPLEFSKSAIRLGNVSPQFADAYEEQLDREEEARYGKRQDIDRAVRERWNQRGARPAGERDDRVREENPRPDQDTYRPE